MKKNILFIIWSFSMGGGAEKILANILNNIDLNKYEIDVLEYMSFGIKEEKIPQEVNRIRPILNYNKSSKYKRYLFDKICTYFPKLLRKIYLNKTYDYEISFNERIPSFLLDDSSTIFCWIHGSMYGIEKTKMQYQRQKKVFQKAKNIIAISEKSQKSIEDLFPEISNKIIKIYNGYSFENIRILSKENKDVILEKQSLVFIGRLDENKQPINAIECLKRLHDKNCYYHLYILGQGELLDAMHKCVEKYKLSNYVHFLGYVENPYPILKQAKTIVSFSKQEGFPTTFVEGLALGTPFISTDVGGAKELSNNGKCGKIFESMDEATNFLNLIYNDKITFDKDECQKFVAQFSIENQIFNLEKILDEKSK